MPDDSDEDGLGDGRDLRAEHTGEYKNIAELLTKRWPCKVHEGKICLGDKTKHIHFVVTYIGELAWILALVCFFFMYLFPTNTFHLQLNKTEGVDLENPPHANPFKDWHYKSPAAVPRRAGARFADDINSTTTAGTTHVTINMPPEAFRGYAATDPHPAPRANPVPSLPVPDVGPWLKDLEESGLEPGFNWNKLRSKFEEQDYLNMPLTRLATVPLNMVVSGFKFTVGDYSVVSKGLEKYGLTLATQ